MFNKLFEKKIKKKKTENEDKWQVRLDELEKDEGYQTEEILCFIREGDCWPGQKCQKYSYKDFNENASFRDYLGWKARFELFYKGKACSQVLLLCIQDDTDIYKIKFGTIQSEESLREHGCMTFLVASVIYIMLKDKDLKQKDIEISLDMSSNAKNILREKKIDVYHRIFRVPKINNNTRELSRRTVFEARNRDKDIDYFRDVLILKEQEIVEAVSNRKVD
ncbi:hypothetical protein [Streptococcus mutans]|uniref:hypothetical protein n=2 Tax=Streptococcus mutans TaxID=1309 RepID=UPI000B540455|nr:hypothetical protein [Streptococcus mutans]